MNQFFSTTILSLSLLGLSACSNLQGGMDTSQLPEPGFASTGSGAATGGVIGAGVGALIGSTTGHPLEGAALGSLAGAATGAAIGHHIEGSNTALRQTEEAQIRQQDLIDNNARELQEFRNRSLDNANARAFAPRASSTNPFPFNRPSRAGYSYSFDNYRGNPRAKSFAANAFAPVEWPPQRTAALAERAPTRDFSPPRLSRTEPPHQMASTGGASNAVSPSFEAAPPIARNSAASELPPAVGAVETSAAAKQAVQPAPVAPAPVAPAAVMPAPKAEPAPAAVQAVPTPAPAPLNPPVAKAVTQPSASSDANCQKAVEEVEVARNAISEADQLFYYRRALRLCPSSSEYHMEIGKVYASLGRKEDAEFELRQAVELDPTNKTAAQLLSTLESAKQ